MSTFAELRGAWDAALAAALPDVQVTWTLDPQPAGMKLPVRVELDGPHTIESTGDRDERRWIDSGPGLQESLVHMRTARITVRAVSRDHYTSPAELTLERVRAALRRIAVHEALLAADCSVRRTGPGVRFDVEVNGRQESVAAMEVFIGWLWTDDTTAPDTYDTIEHAEVAHDGAWSEVIPPLPDPEPQP